MSEGNNANDNELVYDNYPHMIRRVDFEKKERSEDARKLYTKLIRTNIAHEDLIYENFKLKRKQRKLFVLFVSLLIILIIVIFVTNEL